MNTPPESGIFPKFTAEFRCATCSASFQPEPVRGEPATVLQAMITRAREDGWRFPEDAGRAGPWTHLTLCEFCAIALGEAQVDPEMPKFQQSRWRQQAELRRLGHEARLISQGTILFPWGPCE
jgi:hypothetical protein